MAFVDITTLQNYKNNESWTIAFEKAIETLEIAGGGTLYVPAGNYLTGPIVLKSFINLHLESGAQMIFEDCIEKHPLIEISYIGKSLSMYRPLIYAKDAECVSITGQGTLNGQGATWWPLRPAFRAKGLRRPHMICFEQCKNVEICGITCVDSPAWTIHPLRCDQVLIDGITIKNPANSPNTDGIDPNSSKNVRILNCTIDVGDDCIAIKAGTEDSIDPGVCENIIISDCTMFHGHGGIVIGSEMSGTVRNVTVSNCVFQDTDRGIRLKTRRRRGGSIEHLSFQNIIMDGVICPFVANMFYHCGEQGKERHVWDKSPYPVDVSTPRFSDIHISNITVYEAQAAAGFFYGLPEMPIRNITLSHCTIYMKEHGEADMPAMMDQLEPMKQTGFFLRNAEEIHFHQVAIHHVEGNVINADHTVTFEQN